MRPRIDKNNITGLYSTEYAGVTYTFPFELGNRLPDYYRAQRGSVADWYQGLPAVDRGKVSVDGGKQAPEDFFPDAPAD